MCRIKQKFLSWKQKSSLEQEQSFGAVPAQSVEFQRALGSSSEFVVWQVKPSEGGRTPSAPPEGLWHRLLQGEARTEEPLPEEAPDLAAAGGAGTPLPRRRRAMLASGTENQTGSSLPGGIP